MPNNESAKLPHWWIILMVLNASTNTVEKLECKRVFTLLSLVNNDYIQYLGWGLLIMIGDPGRAQESIYTLERGCTTFGSLHNYEKISSD